MELFFDLTNRLNHKIFHAFASVWCCFRITLRIFNLCSFELPFPRPIPDLIFEMQLRCFDPGYSEWTSQKKRSISHKNIYFFLLIDNKTVEKKRRIEWKAHQEESRTNEEMCNLGELWSKLHSTTFQQKCDIEPRIRHQKIWSISANLIAFDVKMDAINIIRFATVAQLLRKCRRKSFATIFVPFSLLFFFSFDFHFDKILLVC